MSTDWSLRFRVRLKPDLEPGLRSDVGLLAAWAGADEGASVGEPRWTTRHPFLLHSAWVLARRFDGGHDLGDVAVLGRGIVRRDPALDALAGVSLAGDVLSAVADPQNLERGAVLWDDDGNGIGEFEASRLQHLLSFLDAVADAEVGEIVGRIRGEHHVAPGPILRGPHGVGWCQTSEDPYDWDRGWGRPVARLDVPATLPAEALRQKPGDRWISIDSEALRALLADVPGGAAAP